MGRILEQINNYAENLKDCAQKSINIVDFGCADGINDAVLFQKIVDTIRKHSQLPICLYLSDLPLQNMTTAIVNIRERVKDDRLFVYGASGSFYDIHFPEEFIDIAVCLNSVPWLQEVIPDSQTFCVCIPPINATNLSLLDAKLLEASEKYLRQFLQNRISELKVGGLLCTNIAMFEDEDNELANLRKQFTQHYWNTLQSVLQKHLENIPNMNFPILLRRPYQVNNILKDFNFKPNYAEVCAVPNILGVIEPYNQEWNAVCKKMAKFFEGFGRGFYTNTLKQAGVNVEKIAEVLDEFYSELEVMLRNQQEGEPRQKDDVGYYLVLSKTQ